MNVTHFFLFFFTLLTFFFPIHFSDPCLSMKCTSQKESSPRALKFQTRDGVLNAE